MPWYRCTECGMTRYSAAGPQHISLKCDVCGRQIEPLSPTRPEPTSPTRPSLLRRTRVRSKEERLLVAAFVVAVATAVIAWASLIRNVWEVLR